MKLSVAIKNDKFAYKYKVGVSEQTGSMPLNDFNLVLFTELLHKCRLNEDKDAKAKLDRLKDEITIKATIEKNPEKVERWLKQVKRRPK